MCGKLQLILVILSGAKRSRRIRFSNKKDGFFDFVGKYCIFSYFAQNDTEMRTAIRNYNLSFFTSGDQPLMLLHDVQRDERQQNRHGLYILLVLGIIAVVLILANFQTAGAAEHDENDADIAHSHNDPLPTGDSTDTGDHHTGPEDHFAQIVGTADNAVQTGVHKTSGIDLLGIVLLDIRSGFQRNTCYHYSRADEYEGIVGSHILQAVEHTGDLGDVQIPTKITFPQSCSGESCCSKKPTTW